MSSRGKITREKILEEATRLVNKKGFDDTSISDLLAATGLKKGCLYFHFSSKEDLMIAVLENAKAYFMTILESSLKGKTAGDRLNGMFNMLMELQRNNGFSGGCIFGNAALEMSDKDEQITGFVKEFFDEWSNIIKEVVKVAQETGQMRADISADVMASHIIMSLEGGIMLSRLEKNEKPLKNCINSLRLLSGLKK